MDWRMGILACSAVLAACGDQPPQTAEEVQTSPLSNGGVRVQYQSLPVDQLPVVQADLRVGSVDEDGPSVFGDVRSVEASGDGTIYVMDVQAAEIRAFDRTGGFLRTVASKGEGPGEITAANGLLLAGDTLLWIQDHGKWMMLAVTPQGEEITRIPMHVRAYGYTWNGTVDHAGRFWKSTDHSDQPRTFPPKEGLTDPSFRLYLKWFDPVSQASDSILVDETHRRVLVAANDRGGYAFFGIPYDPELLVAIDRAGGFWHSNGPEYEVVFRSPVGDTAVVVAADVPRLLVTEEDRADYVRRMTERQPEQLRSAEEAASLMGTTRPAIASLTVDDRSRLWVERHVAEGSDPIYDVFNKQGLYLGSVRLGFQPARFIPLTIRGDNIYAVFRDELDVPFVARAPIPSVIGS